MADAYIEVTEWEGNTPNHIYLLDGDKALAYIKAGEKKPMYFSQPLRISKRGRKFQLLKGNPFKPVAADPVLIAVKGSKGDTYYVDPTEKSCTCPGFTFRGKCKHLESVK